MIPDSIQINYDDDQLKVIEKVNSLLIFYGLELIDDNENHDGFCVIKLVKYDHT